MVKLAYNEDSEQYYVRFTTASAELARRFEKKLLFLILFLLYLGNESCLQEEADEAVWIFA